MIIINQERDTIINFNNIEAITIDTDSIEDELDAEYKIYYSMYDKCMRLGTYRSKYRAKEILKEIANAYKSDFGAIAEIGHFTHSNGLAVYEMPKE